MNLLKENGFIELDVKRRTNEKTNKYCVVYGESRVDKTEITQFDYTHMCSNVYSNKINDINEHKNSSRIGRKSKQSETPTPDGDYESESKEVFYYTDENSEREKQAIKNYLDNGVDSQICYMNPNSTGTIKIKNTVGNNLDKKDCIIINVSELCNSWVWRYKNNDKNLWFFQIWLAKFAFFFNIGNVAKILKWKEQYKNDDDTQQIKSSLSNNDNENNKIKNENENGKENENMAAPPGYNDENNPLESNL